MTVAEFIDVGGNAKGPLSVCVIDATGNIKGWEHETTKLIVKRCRDAGIPVTPGSPHFVGSLEDLTSVGDPEATAVLLVTHGGREPKDSNTARHLWTGKIKQFWEYLRTSGLKLEDRLAVLCICSGFNDDMIAALANSEVGAAIVVAPETPISKPEAEAFFPEFFRRLKPMSVADIQPEVVHSLVDELNPLAGNRMRVALAGQHLKFSVADQLKGSKSDEADEAN